MITNSIVKRKYEDKRYEQKKYEAYRSNISQLDRQKYHVENI